MSNVFEQKHVFIVSQKIDSDDSSDDDKPLIKMIKRPPTDDQIKTTVQDLLKNANLEEVTMKQLCQKVSSQNASVLFTNNSFFLLLLLFISIHL